PDTEGVFSDLRWWWTFRVYRLQQTQGRWLWLVDRHDNHAGWAPTDRVVPLERAVDYFSEVISADPGTSLAYRHRACLRMIEGKHGPSMGIWTGPSQTSIKRSDNPQGVTWRTPFEETPGLTRRNSVRHLLTSTRPFGSILAASMPLRLGASCRWFRGGGTRHW